MVIKKKPYHMERIGNKYMEKSRLAEYLKGVVNFQDRDLTILAGSLDRQVYKKGSILIEESKTFNRVGFINKGLVKKFYTTFEGKEFIKDFASEFEILAPYSSLLLKKDPSFTVKCLEDTDISWIDWSEIKSLFSKNIRWMELGKKMAEIYFIRKEEREAELLKLSAKNRLEAFRKRKPDLIKRLKKQDIASYLGITPASLSRILD